MHKLGQFLDGVAVYFFISGIVSISIAMFLPTWRKNLGAVVLSVVIGGIAGYGIESVDRLSDWSYLISLIVTVFATPLVAWAISGGDMKSLAKDIIEVGEYMKNRERK